MKKKKKWGVGGFKGVPMQKVWNPPKAHTTLMHSLLQLKKKRKKKTFTRGSPLPSIRTWAKLCRVLLSSHWPLWTHQEPLASATVIQWWGSMGRGQNALCVSIDKHCGLGSSPHKYLLSASSLLGGYSKRGGARSPSMGYEKRRLRAALSKTIAQTR